MSKSHSLSFMLGVVLSVARVSLGVGGQAADQTAWDASDGAGLIDEMSLSQVSSQGDLYLEGSSIQHLVVTPGTALANVGSFTEHQKAMGELGFSAGAVEVEQFILSNVPTALMDQDSSSAVADLSGLVGPVGQDWVGNQTSAGPFNDQAVLVGEMDFRIYELVDLGN